LDPRALAALRPSRRPGCSTPGGVSPAACTPRWPASPGTPGSAWHAWTTGRTARRTAPPRGPSSAAILRRPPARRCPRRGPRTRTGGRAAGTRPLAGHAPPPVPARSTRAARPPRTGWPRAPAALRSSTRPSSVLLDLAIQADHGVGLTLPPDLDVSEHARLRKLHVS